MSITDELRKWGRATLADTSLLVRMEAIADRIDAEHQKALDEWKAKQGQMWLKGYSECHAELLEGNETLASDLERCGWIRLPKDTGDEYINEHDKVDWRDHAGMWHENATVVAACNDGCYVIDGTVFHVHKSDIRHHHAPTVEDVLREFADEVYADADNEIRDRDFLCAKYAKRLRLAEREDA